MRRLALLGLVLLSLGSPAGAQTPIVQPTNAAGKVTTSPAVSPELDMIRQAASEFETAFNAGNAAAVAALWTDDGEYVDEDGQSFVGRKAIEGEYSKTFAAAKGQRIRIAIDSLEMLSDTTAYETGRTFLEPAPKGAPSMGRYTAMHRKVNDKWLMSKVTDVRVELASTYDALTDLEWLIGTWVAEEHGVRTESVCQWIGNKSFVQRSYTVTNPDQTTSTGVQMIGFNPQGGHLQSWSFSADGGHAVGTWWPQENGWLAEVRGTLANGDTTSATNLLTRLDDNAYVWQSIRRTVNGKPLPDTEEVVLKRQSQ